MDCSMHRICQTDEPPPQAPFNGLTCCSPDGSEVAVVCIVVKVPAQLAGCLASELSPQQLPEGPAQQSTSSTWMEGQAAAE